MIWTLFSLLSMVVLGGFISYYGDLQGRRWGKKRVSWFGMRPKHTAILITSLTGAFISLLSVLTLLLVSPTVRDVITQGERAIRDNKRLAAEERKNLEDYKRQSAEAQRQKESAEQERSTAQERQKQADAQLVATQRQLTDTQRLLQDTQHQLAVSQTDLKVKQELNRHLTAINRGLAVTNRSLARQNQTLTRQNQTLTQQNGSLAVQNKTLTIEQAKLLRDNDDLTKTKAVLLKTNGIINKANQTVEEENHQKVEEYHKKLDAMTEQLVQVGGQLDRAHRELDQAYGDLAGSGQLFVTTYNQMRQGRITVRAGGELARCLIDAHMGPAAIAAQLKHALDEASKTATQYGAASNDNNGRAVRIVSKRVLTDSGEVNLYEQDSLLALGNNLQGSDQPVVVVVSAFSNAVEGEQVPVEMHASTVVSMFASGTVLASRRIDAGMSDEDLKQAISEFFGIDVRDAALKAGAIPQVEPRSGLSEVGQYDAIDVGQLALKVRQMRGEVVLRAVAATAITSADPLDRKHLRIEVVRAPGKNG
jgi:uncharacterized protein (DUF3084 family)